MNGILHSLFDILYFIFHLLVLFILLYCLSFFKFSIPCQILNFILTCMELVLSGVCYGCLSCAPYYSLVEDIVEVQKSLIFLAEYFVSGKYRTLYFQFKCKYQKRGKRVAIMFFLHFYLCCINILIVFLKDTVII